MREWLSPSEDQSQSQMALTVLSQAPKPMQLELAPEVVRLLDRELKGMAMVGPQAYPGNASTVLTQLGKAAIPALEKGAESEDETVRKQSQALLEELRKAPSDDKPSEPKR